MCAGATRGLDRTRDGSYRLAVVECLSFSAAGVSLYQNISYEQAECTCSCGEGLGRVRFD